MPKIGTLLQKCSICCENATHYSGYERGRCLNFRWWNCSLWTGISTKNIQQTFDRPKWMTFGIGLTKLLPGWEEMLQVAKNCAQRWLIRNLWKKKNHPEKWTSGTFQFWIGDGHGNTWKYVKKRWMLLPGGMTPWMQPTHWASPLSHCQGDRRDYKFWANPGLLGFLGGICLMAHTSYVYIDIHICI